MQVFEIEDFDDTFEQAELNASTTKEMAFIEDFRDKLEQYGEKTYVSEKQLDWLESIARK